MPNEKYSAFDQDTDTFVVVELDKKTRSLVVVSHDEHMLHEGKAYIYEGYKNVSAGGTYNFQIVTPDVGTEEVHFRYKVFCEDHTTVDFYENVNSSSGGTPVTMHNANRVMKDYLPEASTRIDVNPTIGSGVLLSSIHIGSSREAGQLDDSGEWLLEGNKRYLLVCTNNAATAQDITLIIRTQELSSWN